MDIAQPPRVSATGSVGVVARSDVVAVPGGIAVDLPAEQTVQSVQAGEAVRVEIRAQQEREARSRAQAQPRRPDQHVSIEPETRTVVVEMTDPATGRTISQLPDETLLKLRIFSRQLAERAQSRPDDGHHEFEQSA